jgi:hypothetical protein
MEEFNGLIKALMYLHGKFNLDFLRKLVQEVNEIFGLLAVIVSERLHTLVI